MTNTQLSMEASWHDRHRGALPQRYAETTGVALNGSADRTITTGRTRGGPAHVGRGGSRASTPAISRIAPWGDDERHVVVRARAGDGEADQHDVEERRVGELRGSSAKIVADVEDEFPSAS